MHWIHWLMDWIDLIFSVTDPQRSWKIISSLLGWPQPWIHSYISIPLQKDCRGFQSAELLRLEWVQGPFSTGCGNLSLTTNLSSWEQELSASEGRALVGGAGGRSRSDSLGCDNPFYTWRWRCFFFKYLSSQQCLILSGLHFEGKCPIKNTTGTTGSPKAVCVCLFLYGRLAWIHWQETSVGITLWHWF